MDTDTGNDHLDFTHDEKTLGAIEGQVLDDSKNTKVTKSKKVNLSLLTLFRRFVSFILLLSVNKFVWLWQC